MKKRDDMLLETQKDNQRLKQLIILYQNRPKEAPRKVRRTRKESQRAVTARPAEMAARLILSASIDLPEAISWV